jgi:hypothetical protein
MIDYLKSVHKKKVLVNPDLDSSAHFLKVVDESSNSMKEEEEVK